jgi:hypothetical protein
VPVLLGVAWHFRWLLFRQPEDVYELGWSYVGVMLLTAVSCRLGAFFYRQTAPRISATYFFGAAASTLVGAAGSLAVLGLKSWTAQAPLLMLLPMAYLLAAHLYRGRTPAAPLLVVAHAATVVMLLSSLVGITSLTRPEQIPFTPLTYFTGLFLERGVTQNLLVAAFFGMATLFYVLAVAVHGQRRLIYAATVTGCAVVWQLLSYALVGDLIYLLTFAGLGLLLLLGYRFAVLERFQVSGLADVVFRCGNALLTVALAAGLLLGLSHLVPGRDAEQWSLTATLATLVLFSLAAVVLVRDSGWRRWYVVAALLHGGLAVVVLALFSALTLGQKAELVAVILGMALLVIGHVGWYREQEQHNDLVSVSLFLGSTLVAVALSVAVISWRYLNEFHWVDELGLLAAGTLFFLTGVMCRLKTTTLTGALQLLLWFATLLIFLPWSEWQRQLGLAAILLMVGGGTIFIVGLLLSVYRDRLLALPEQVRQRRGIFRVLSWR